MPTERPPRMSVSKRSPTIMMRERSPEWPCSMSISIACSIMYSVPRLPPLPRQCTLSRHFGYMIFLIISANMPGPGIGKT